MDTAMDPVPDTANASLQTAGPRTSTGAPPVRTPVRRRGRRLRARLALLVLSVVTLCSACTVTSGAHYQIDLVVSGYHFHVYQLPTSQIWLMHLMRCGSDADCTLEIIWSTLDINGLVGAAAGVHEFFDDTEDIGDFAGALAEATPSNPSVNQAWRFGCLGGYRNTSWPWNDGDWYGSAYNGDWCRYGQSLL